QVCGQHDHPSGHIPRDARQLIVVGFLVPAIRCPHRSVSPGVRVIGFQGVDLGDDPVGGVIGHGGVIIPPNTSTCSRSSEPEMGKCRNRQGASKGRPIVPPSTPTSASSTADMGRMEPTIPKAGDPARRGTSPLPNSYARVSDDNTGTPSIRAQPTQSNRAKTPQM